MNIAVSTFLIIATTVGFLELYGFYLLYFVLFIDYRTMQTITPT